LAGVTDMPTPPRAISHIAPVVRDPARTAQLFEQVFGTRVVRRERASRGPAESYLYIGAVWLVLVKGEPPASRGDDHIAFAVSEDELDSYAARLRGLGVESQLARAAEAAKSLYFVDYDNHLFELHTGQLERELENP
jgi:catechol 2,3-dioxygenase-like lactoylglutathione lyase family enzyme